ncbi:zinc ABC transporter ATP-binding protein ZurA [Listeria monocytogenes]|uniref:zinc ABC transporter ATP-binding protein ZurA n=1 Tax=Listeria monocytogenes TaxID=1639 RepID=UPI000BE01893|nr:zinc ABC transporter ATP-binding protein ZurA [Listeria monocytogenes]EAC2390008.1 metal ABC transporter ATP-binding protein [Listeria monocytogenes]EAC9384141.1 metal ABC transporter ATP-binding protein [Listeria monocytogenes]EAD2914646.1 metal ABC transporter ATP-binding protein [Listeria monocytogenes]EAD8959235.1 metal ABC transporter ATP-binding protein [Listeria monocytogenes]EAG5900927.1 metal ABC transporter ATP-binding protein [Listeria monocytogenes]
MNKIIEVNNVSYHYDKEHALENIHFQVAKGSFTGLIGPNGSGKSTMLKLILGVLKKQQGSISLFGEKQADFKDWVKIGFVSQKSNAFNSAFPATVKEVVASGLTKKKSLFKTLNNKDKEDIDYALKRVEMTDYLHRNIGELSGGQQQRVFIARALVSRPELLILDEPTVGVDVENVKAFYELLAELNRTEEMTLLLVTHDLMAVNTYVNHVISINKRIIFDGSAHEYQHYLADRELEILAEQRRREDACLDCDASPV